MKKYIKVRRIISNSGKNRYKFEIFAYSKMDSMFLKCLSDKTAKITLVETKAQNL
jgi:hypothetical protein